jgi:hypothetical protein
MAFPATLESTLGHAGTIPDRVGQSPSLHSRLSSPIPIKSTTLSSSYSLQFAFPPHAPAPACARVRQHQHGIGSWPSSRQCQLMWIERRQGCPIGAALPFSEPQPYDVGLGGLHLQSCKVQRRAEAAPDQPIALTGSANEDLRWDIYGVCLSGTAGVRAGRCFCGVGKGSRLGASFLSLGLGSCSIDCGSRSTRS